MSLISLGISEITLENIKNLIKDEVCESKYIEYKRELTLSKNIAEFLNDLTAMANSEGGDIIYGIEEEQGNPVKIVDTYVDDLDGFQQKIENTLRDNIAPRIKYDIKFIETGESTYLILIRIPKSTNAPHMVIPGGHGFYIRNLSGKHRMSVDELRECFMTSAGYSKEAYLFHLKDELEYNKEALCDIGSYLTENPPIANAFESISIGSSHLRLEAWDSLVKAGILPLLPTEQQKLFQDADKSIRETVRLIQMKNAEWKRVLEFNQWYKTNGAGQATQIAPLNIVYHQMRTKLFEKINDSLQCINLTLKVFN